MEEGHALRVREEPGAELGDLTLRISLRPHSETGATNEPVCWRRKQRLKARGARALVPGQHRVKGQRWPLESQGSGWASENWQEAQKRQGERRGRGAPGGAKSREEGASSTR